MHIWESVKTQGEINMNTAFYNKIKKFLYSKDLKIIEYERSPRAIHIEKNIKKTYDEAVHGEIYSLRWGEYDCKADDGSYYPLNKDKTYTQLVFIGNKNIPFTTLRNKDKYIDYIDMIGHTFNIEVENDR